MEVTVGDGAVRVNVMKSPYSYELANITVLIEFYGYEYALFDKIAIGRVYTVAEEKLYGGAFKTPVTGTVSILTRPDTVEFRFSNLLVITGSERGSHLDRYYYDIVSVQEMNNR